MGSQTLDLNTVIQPNGLATQIANTFQEWEIFRNNWLTSKQEIQRYIFATDTTTTTNSTLPWKNSTHMPKLCQVRDNLNANYMSALFPNDRPVVWEGDDVDADAKEKRLVIESYMENKMRMSGFRTEIQKCVNDWIDYGNCFAMTEFVAEEIKDPQTGEMTSGYVGPKLVRISPLDIVFNPTASSFAESPKIIRSVLSLGTLKAMIEDKPEMGYLSEVFNNLLNYRKSLSGISQGDNVKNGEYQVAGFSSFMHYLRSGYVEILDFYGDIYDQESGEFHKNVCISVVDRCHVIRNIPNPSWLGRAGIFHCGWRLRPDNLYAMGPLDNLVGMQYRIDHLENAKADAYDLIIHPVLKIKGFVEDFDYGPGERIYIGDEGEVEFERPDTTMLSADTQIQMYEQKMEEMAGAPKQAMGFRTPGEKTAYEVQILENGSNRIFLNKTSYFEEVFMEPSLNAMLEVARRNMSPSDLIRVVDDQYGVVNFMKITKDDISAKGKIRPIGARHFARNANLVQNLTQLAGSALGQDQAVNSHISGKKIAHLMEELLGIEQHGIVQDNIRIYEMIESQQIAQSAQQMLGEQQGIGGTPAANPMVQPPTQGQPSPVQAAGPRK